MSVDRLPVGRPHLRSAHRRAPLCLALLALLLFGATTPADTASGPSYGARPAHHGDTDLDAMAYTHATEVGTAIRDAVEVFNFSGGPAAFEIYTADMTTGLSGIRAPAARDIAVTGPGSWITPALARIELDARSSELVEFTIDIPVGTPPGSYAAALLVERDVDVRGDTVVNRTRISLPIDLEVLGEIDLGVLLEPLIPVRDGRTVRFELPIGNTGNVTFEATGRVGIGDDPAQHEEEVLLAPAAQVMAPEATATLTGVWEDPPWFGRVTASPTVEARVGDRTPQLVAGAPVTFWLVPWWHLIAAAVLAALVIAVVVGTRDRRRQWFTDRRDERALVQEFRQQRRAERQEALTS